MYINRGTLLNLILKGKKLVNFLNKHFYVLLIISTISKYTNSKYYKFISWLIKIILSILLYLACAVILLGLFNYILYGDIFTTIHCSSPEIVNNPEVLNTEAILELLINLMDWLIVAQIPHGGYDIINQNVFSEMVSNPSFYFWLGELDGVNNVLGFSVDNTNYTVDPNLIIWFIAYSVSILIMYHN
jgi:hypothetical protein